MSVTVSGATATADTDFTAAPAAFALTIDTNAPSATATFALTPVDDLVEEDDETVEVGGVAGDLTVEPATITLTDDDRGAAGGERRDGECARGRAGGVHGDARGGGAGSR